MLLHVYSSRKAKSNINRSKLKVCAFENNPEGSSDIEESRSQGGHRWRHVKVRGPRNVHTKYEHLSVTDQKLQAR